MNENDSALSSKFTGEPTVMHNPGLSCKTLSLRLLYTPSINAIP